LAKNTRQNSLKQELAFAASYKLEKAMSRVVMVRLKHLRFNR